MNHKIFTHVPKKIAVVVMATLAFAMTSMAADVVMTAGDAFGGDSFDAPGNWSDSATPSSGNNYYSSNFVIRTSTVTNLTRTFTFQGGPLTLNPGGNNNPYPAGGSVYMKISGGVCSFPNGVTNLGRLANAFAPNSIVTWAGKMTVPLEMVTNTVGSSTNVFGTNGYIINPGGAFDVQSGNQGDTTDVRYVTNDMTMYGDGYLTNMPSQYLPATPMPPGYVTYIGDSSQFHGSIVVLSNIIVIALDQTNLFGDSGSFRSNSLLMAGGVFQLYNPTNASTNPPPIVSSNFTFDTPNCGIWISEAGGQFDIPPGYILTNAMPIGGPGTLTLTNTGTFVCEGSASNFTGTLSVNIGTLILATNNALTGPCTISIGPGGTFDASADGMDLGEGGTLEGNGTVGGTVVCGTNSTISPGGPGNVANLGMNGLTLTGDGTLDYDFSVTTNDVINVNGDLTASGLTTIKFSGLPAVTGDYTLMTVSGTMGAVLGNFTTNLLITRGTTVTLSMVAGTPNRLMAHITVSPPGNVVYTNNVNNTWDVATTQNWETNNVLTLYYDLDNVYFTDVGATNPTNQNYVSLNTSVIPRAVSFNSSSNYYLTGTGSIGGSTALTQSGSGRTLISTTNTYSGGTTVTNGVLALGAPAALGNPSTTLAVVSGNGTLDIHGQPLDTTYNTVIPIQVSGSGYNGQGAIDNTIGGFTSGSGDMGVGTVELMGNTSVGASANWQLGSGGAVGIVGNGYTLTKIVGGGGATNGPTNNLLYLVNTAPASPPSSFVIAGGGVVFWNTADSVGTATPIILTNGGFIDTWDPADNNNGLTFYNPITVSGSKGGLILNQRPVTFNHPPYDVFNGNVNLQGTLVVSNVNTYTTAYFGRDTFNGNISGPGGITAYGSTTLTPFGNGGLGSVGGNQVNLNGVNTYTGPTKIVAAFLNTSTASQGGGSYEVDSKGTLDVALSSFSPATMPMSSLTVTPSPYYYAPNISFARLPQMPTVPVIYATNLTITTPSGSFACQIYPPGAGYSIGQFPLIGYGTMSGSFSGLNLAALPGGVTGYLSNNATAHTIDLVVTAAGKEWTGAANSNWDDISFDYNWYTAAAGSTYFADYDSVVFPDNATNYDVVVSSTNIVAGITVNSTNNYNFIESTNGQGALTGEGALTKFGSGTLTIGTTNDYTGGTYIYGGTVKLTSRSALNRDSGYVDIANGATLDVNNEKVPGQSGYTPDGYNVFVSGAGVGGNGALINSATNYGDPDYNPDNADAGHVTLIGSTTVGGAGDLNIRHGVNPQLNSLSNSFVLTKVGSGRFRIRYVARVSTNFGLINILDGIVSYESASTLGLGDPTKDILVGSGAGFAWGTTNVTCVRPLICSNNSTLYGYTITSNQIASPVTLVSGNVTLSGIFNTNGVVQDSYHGLVFSNVISGSGGVTVDQRSIMTFAAANTYTGDTVVSSTLTNNGATAGSILRLVGSGTISSLNNIILYGTNVADGSYAATLDASGRTDGTLTLSGQTLRGDDGSVVAGNVVAASSTITPGGSANVQYMTFSNNLTLGSGSTVMMDVSTNGGGTNDVINVIGTNNYGGTLHITALTTVALGDSFQLFNNGQYTGNFSSVTGTLPAGLEWTFDPATGIATVTSPSVSGPTITWSVTGGNLTLGWAGVSATNIYTLQAQTNPLSIGLSNNWVNVPDSRGVTQMVFGISYTNGAVFYRLNTNQ